jgi:hypothetical protein
LVQILNKIKTVVREFFSPGTKSLPADGSGFKANFYIRFLRSISRLIINCLCLNGRNRWSNEFIQALDPQLTSKVNSGNSYPTEKLKFRTGHGRLFWRATESVNLEPETNEWIRTFTKRFFFALFPLIVLLILAVGRRVSEYGVTENRYFQEEYI